MVATNDICGVGTAVRGGGFGIRCRVGVVYANVVDCLGPVIARRKCRIELTISAHGVEVSRH